MIDIQYPKIDSATTAGKIEQIRSYLFQLANQINHTDVVVETAWTDLGISDAVKFSKESMGRIEKSGCYYRIDDGKRVYVAFNCKFDYSGSALRVNAKSIPQIYRPATTVRSLCVTSDNKIAVVSVNRAGNIYIDKIFDIASATIEAVDGYIDYWLNL